MQQENACGVCYTHMTRLRQIYLRIVDQLSRSQLHRGFLYSYLLIYLKSLTHETDINRSTSRSSVGYET